MKRGGRLPAALAGVGASELTPGSNVRVRERAVNDGGDRVRIEVVEIAVPALELAA